MAARKQKAKPRGASRTSSAPARKPVPGWIWLLSGAAIGGFLVFLSLLEPGRDEVKRAPAAKPESAASKPATPPAPPRPKYEFYEELTKATPAPLPTQEQIEAVEAARAQALLEGRTPPPRLVATPPATASSQTTPAPIPTKPAAAAAQTPPAQPKPATAPATSLAKPASESATRYFLQAGSFGNRDQAESARARLILLGQDARIESGQVGGKTWHRVVVGPFASRPQADSAQKQLGANGVSSVVQQRR
jgi:cell division protein FtsN